MNPHRLFDNAAKIAKYAHKNYLTFVQACVKLELLAEEKVVKPENMINTSDSFINLDNI